MKAVDSLTTDEILGMVDSWMSGLKGSIAYDGGPVPSLSEEIHIGAEATRDGLLRIAAAIEHLAEAVESRR